MKKLLTLFAVFALTAPVFAGEGDPNVRIKCEDLGSGLVQVSYEILTHDGFDPDAEGNRVRGFAFDIEASNSCTITAISEYDAEGASVPADSENIPLGYSVHMGSIVIGPQDPNFVTDFGDPVAPNTDPGALGGLGTTGITVELGSLYVDDGQGDPEQPPASGNLFKIQLSDPTSAGSCVLTIAGEGTRGECVLEGGDPANILSSGCEVTFACYIEGQQRGSAGCVGSPATITATHVQNWINAGSPDEWCCPWQPCGDTNGDGYVNPSDFIAIVANPAAPASQAPGADTNHDGFINPSDFIAVVGHPAQGNGVPCPPLP
jgi:hypothetical protein